jgi:hypothetical protein
VKLLLELGAYAKNKVRRRVVFILQRALNRLFVLRMLCLIHGIHMRVFNAS